MKKLAVAVLLISGVFITGVLMAGFVALGLDLMSHLEGYISQCSFVKLPYVINIIFTEMVLATIFSCLYIYSEFYGLTKTILKYLIIIFTFNLTFIAYKVIQFPLLIQVSSIWGERRTTSSELFHPLLFISLFYALLIVLLIYRNKEKIANKFFNQIIYGIVILVISIEFMITYSTKFEHCCG